MTTTLRRSFPRRIDALPALFAFTEEAFARAGIAADLRGAVDFVLEELFTNMVKYSPEGEAHVAVDLTPIQGGVEVGMTDRGVQPFDVTAAPDAAVGLPIEQRTPGGLGLHILRRLVDAIHYEYRPDLRESRITFRKTLDGHGMAATPAQRGETDAGH